MSEGQQQPDQFAENFPSYVRFKPSPVAIEMHTNLTQQLQMFERKISTSNNIPVKALAEQHLLPIVLLLHQWMLAAQADLLEHTHDIANFIQDENSHESIDPDLLVVTIDFLTTFITAMNAAAKSEEEFATIGAAMTKQFKLPLELHQLAEKAPPLLAALQATLEALEGEEEEDEEEEPADENDGDLFEDDTPAPAPAESEGGGEGRGTNG